MDNRKVRRITNIAIPIRQLERCPWFRVVFLGGYHVYPDQIFSAPSPCDATVHRVLQFLRRDILLITPNVVLPMLPNERPKQAADHSVKHRHQEQFEFPVSGVVQQTHEGFGLYYHRFILP
jgi:hypothetical protein